MGEIMNLGIPLICNSGVGDVDGMEQCIPELLIKEFTKEEYNRAIDLLTNNYKANREKIINTSYQYYSLEKGVEKYKDLQQDLELMTIHDDTSPFKIVNALYNCSLKSSSPFDEKKSS